MQTRLLSLWDTFRSSFWFVPAVMMVLAVVSGLSLIWVDASIEHSFYGSESIFRMSPPAARSILSSIVGAMVTSTGVVFSITVVALSLASSQFGSRLIRTYRNRRSTHFTLGIFVSTSLFCILALASIRELEGYSFVPTTAVVVGILLTIVCLATLIYYIHDISKAIQAPNVILSSAADLDVAIDRMFPEPIGEPAEENDAATDEKASEEAVKQYTSQSAAMEVFGESEGYIQAIENETIIHVACESESVIVVKTQPGDFVSKGTKLADVFEVPSAENDEENEDDLESLACRIRGAFIVGATRTPTQDVRYAFNELTEIAIRALSPGINDPFTAMTCIDRIETALLRLKDREDPQPCRVDESGRVCVIAHPVTYDCCRKGSLGMIASYVDGSPRVKERLEAAMHRTELS